MDDKELEEEATGDEDEDGWQEGLRGQGDIRQGGQGRGPQRRRGRNDDNNDDDDVDVDDNDDEDADADGDDDYDDDDGDVQTLICSRLRVQKIHPVENAK